MSDSDYVEDSAVGSDYNFDAESEHGTTSAPRRPDNTSTELRTKKYPAYNELLREARNVYGDDNPPPFVSKLKGSASKDVVLPARDGSYPAKLTPGSVMTLVRRHWRGPFSFWTVEHEGQRFIVKGLSKTSPTRPGRWYRRWAGTKEGFGKEIFLVPYKQSFGRAINQTTKTSSKFMKSGTAGTSHGRRSKQTSRTRSSASTAPSRQPTAPKRQRPKVKPEPADELQTELEQLEAQEDHLEQELLRKKLRKIQRRKSS
ncbi:hypothetical protein XPA_001910 [Xanthoria parietina]